MSQATVETPARTHAQAEVAVHRHESEPFDDQSTPALVELRLWERFTGDIEAESTVRALQLRDGSGAVRQVSLQRVTGTLGDREGTFVLQGSGTVQDGAIASTWFVVPGSGTGDLAGLRGEGGFEGKFGQGSTATLDFWFE
jgi:hypothetical protein